MKKKRRSKVIFAILLLISSVALTYFLIKLNLLPSLILVITIAIIILINLLIFVLVKSRSKVKRGFGITISIILSIIFTFTSILSFQGLNVLDKILQQINRTEISVIVMNDSPIMSIDELANQSVGYSSQSNLLVSENTDYYSQKGIILTQDLDYITLVSQLNNGLYPAIIIDEQLRSFVEENVDWFSDNTRVIDTIKVDAPSDLSSAKEVDVKKQGFNIYISGIDTYGSPAAVSRTDSNTIITVNPTTGKILQTSMPRDYYVPLSCANGALDKFTHSGIYGIDCSINTLEDLFATDINYYVRVNFTGFINLIDALGGVDVESKYAFSAGGYSFKTGTNHLNSNQALVFSRERHSLPNGDNDRIVNQQAVITAVMNKLLSPSVVANFPSVMASIGDNVTTNIPQTTMTDILKVLISNGSSTQITTQVVTGSGTRTTGSYSIPQMSLYVMIPDQNSVDAAINNINSILSE